MLRVLPQRDCALLWCGGFVSMLGDFVLFVRAALRDLPPDQLDAGRADETELWDAATERPLSVGQPAPN